MLGFLIKYNFKTILRNKSAMFWSLAFPFILASVYGFTIGNLDKKNSKVDAIPVMVESKAYETVFRMIDQNGKNLFDVKPYRNPEEALDKGEIKAYLKGSEQSPELVVKRAGASETIFRSVVNYLHHNALTIGEILKNPDNRDKIADIMKDIERASGTELSDGVAGANKSRVTVIFYGLMAMICMGATTFGIMIAETSNLKSDVKETKRIAVSPIPRGKYIMADFAATAVITSVSTLILFAYLKYGVKVEFGNDTLKLVIGMVAGNIMAIFLGMFLASVLTCKSETKISIGAGVYVFSAGFSGMMAPDLAVMMNKIPFFTRVNPGSVLSNMFTSLYLFDDSKEYLTYLLNLAVITLVLAAGLKIAVRRRQHDSV